MPAIGFLLLFLMAPADGGPALPQNAPASEAKKAAPAGNRVSATLEKLENLWEVAAGADAQKRHFFESQEVLQEERLEWMSQRDRLTVTLQGMARRLEAREKRLRELVEALYKISHVQAGPSRWRSRWVRPARDGRFLLMVLLEREVAERKKIREEIRLLQARRKQADRTIDELQKLEENFRLMALDAENLANRSLFAIREMESKLEGANKNTFDAVDWQRYGRIQQLRAFMRNPSSTLARYKGMMLKPVAGPPMPATPGAPALPGLMYAASPGAPVRATHDGTVRFVGPLEGYGTVIVIEHEFDIHSIIGRVDAPTVQAGSVVRRGQVIARTPDGPPSSVRPVYLELRQGREKLDVDLWVNKNM